MPAIETQALEKHYAGNDQQIVQAVCGVNLIVNSSEIYALLGPNGAGKTTLLAMLITLLLPSAGSAHVAGFDVVTAAAEVRRRIGVTFQEVVLDQELTGRQVLDFHGQLYGQNRNRRHAKIVELAQLVELSDVLDRRAGKYSGGMKRRLELARGLMTEPSVLFLDEPTQGLDPQNRAGIWAYIRRLRAEKGVTVLLTTHYMEEAEALADRVGIIDHGRLVVEGAPADLVRQMGADVVAISGSGAGDIFLQSVAAQSYVTKTNHHVQPDGLHRLQIGVDAGDQRLAALIGLAMAAGFQVQTVNVAKPSLADVFLAHTGRELRDR
ncbi:MAG: ATP-binding cassette domain-containing protein [Chloroflexota bacterium]|nr:ATP-binding cassette domain-containing protein [Chloroflexota bacterium]